MLVADDDGWFVWVDDASASVRVRLAESADGRLHVSAIQIEDQDQPISASTLRSVPLGRIEAAANAQLHPLHASDVSVPQDALIPPELFEGAHGRPDAFYAHVAAVYRTLVTQTKQPVASIAEANAVPRTTAHRWVKEARNRGLLPPGRAGKAG